MPNELDIDKILKDRKKNTRLAAYPPEVRKERQREQMRRRSQVYEMTISAIRELHREEWDELFRQAKKKVEHEAGPLPGDPPA
jgi:hypothetical protein